MAFTQNLPPDFLAKVMIVGDAASGKTKLRERFDMGTYSESYVPTTGVDVSVKRDNFLIDGSVEKDIKLQIWDTSGTEFFRIMSNGLLEQMHVVIVAFDMTSDDSFTSAVNFIKNFRNDLKSTSIPIILAGTKSDSEYAMSDSAIALRIGEESLDISTYIRTSAKNSENVTELYSQAVEHAWKMHRYLIDKIENARRLSDRVKALEIDEKERLRGFMHDMAGSPLIKRLVVDMSCVKQVGKVAKYFGYDDVASDLAAIASKRKELHEVIAHVKEDLAASQKAVAARHREELEAEQARMAALALQQRQEEEKERALAAKQVEQQRRGGPLRESTFQQAQTQSLHQDKPLPFFGWLRSYIQQLFTMQPKTQMTLPEFKDLITKELIDYCYQSAPEVRGSIVQGHGLFSKAEKVPNQQGKGEEDSLLADSKKVKSNFWVNEENRLRRKRANYYLARRLINEVQKVDSFQGMLNLFKRERLQDIRKETKLEDLGGINSRTLNKTINKGKSISHAHVKHAKRSLKSGK